MNIHELANLSGVSVRTLQYYDSISLLCPMRNEENGYRIYEAEHINKLQQILFFKECGFSLKKIKSLMTLPNFDISSALEMQRKFLLHERKRIEQMLSTIEKTIKNLKGELEMNDKEKFSGLNFANNPYENEARKLWGDDTVDKSKTAVLSLSDIKQEELSMEMHSLFCELAKIKHEDPVSDISQKAIAKMFEQFNKNFGDIYTPEIFGNLGQTYITDERFKMNIDKYAEGLSDFLAKAMAEFAIRNNT